MSCGPPGVVIAPMKLGGRRFVWARHEQRTGDLLSFYDRVTRIGNTSISVEVEVFAERNPTNLHVMKVTEAHLTYVAIDGQGQPRPVR